jgi:hypothetical protein
MGLCLSEWGGDASTEVADAGDQIVREICGGCG